MRFAILMANLALPGNALIKLARVDFLTCTLYGSMLLYEVYYSSFVTNFPVPGLRLECESCRLRLEHEPDS